MSHHVENGTVVEVDDSGEARTIGDGPTVYIEVPDTGHRFPGDFNHEDLVIDDDREWKVVAMFPVDPALPHPLTWDEVTTGPGRYALADVSARGAGAAAYPDENAGWVVLKQVR